MYVKIRTKDVHFSMPVPVGMIGLVLKLIPERMFEQMRENTPLPYRSLVTKKTVCLVWGQCLDVLKGNKGLEIVHVEAKDGTFVSIRL